MWIYEHKGEVVIPNAATHNDVSHRAATTGNTKNSMSLEPTQKDYDLSIFSDDLSHGNRHRSASAQPLHALDRKEDSNSSANRVKSEFALQKKRLKNRLLGVVLLYLCGTLIAGLLYPRSPHQLTQYMNTYLTQKLALCADGDVIKLFFDSLLSALFGTTLIFLSGLSAFGSPFVLLLILCKGIGNGLLFLSALYNVSLLNEMRYLIIFTATHALCAACMCSLAIYAIRNAHGMFRLSIHTQASQDVGIKEASLATLSSQYILYCVLLIVVCLCTSFLMSASV